MKLKSIHAAPALLIIVLALQCAVSLADPSKLGLNSNLYLAMIVLQLLVFALPSMFFVKLRGHSYRKELRFSFFGISSFPIVFSALGFMICGSAVISSGVYAIMPTEYASSSVLSNAAFVTSDGFFGLIYIGLAFALIPAICEEFLFRSILAAEYERSGILTAALLSSVSFAIFHMSLAQLPTDFFAGLVLFAVMYATRSVLASMLVHFLNNIAFFFIDSVLPKVFYGSAATPTLFMFILITLSLIFAVIFFNECEKAYKKYAKAGFESRYAKKPKGGALSNLLIGVISPTFLIFMIFAVVVTIIS